MSDPYRAPPPEITWSVELLCLFADDSAPFHGRIICGGLYRARCCEHAIEQASKGCRVLAVIRAEECNR